MDKAFGGQSKLNLKYEQCTLDNLPRSLLLIGEKGCGKHLFLQLLSSKLNLEVIELDDKLTLDDIDKISMRSFPAFYLLDLSNVLPKYQNTLLKLIEEPPQSAYFFIISESVENILPTILNRCTIWYFEKYSRDYLNTFIKSTSPTVELILNTARTPGQVLEYQNHPIQDISSLALNIVNHIGIASLTNTLTISNKIAFKNEKDKFDLDILIELITYNLLEKIKVDNNPALIKMHKELTGLKTSLQFSISKQRTFENFLIRFRRAARDVTT